MDEKEIIYKAIEEIESKSFGFTGQFLEIHEVVNEGGNIKIARIDREREDGCVIAYFPVKDQKFYFTIHMDTSPKVVVRHVSAEPYVSIYFKAISENMDFDQLSALTLLQNTGGWSKGEKRGAGAAFRRNSCIRFEPNPEPDDFEDKLKKLLDFLEQDMAGIQSLIQKASGYIQVAMEFHNGNTMLGGPHISLDLIKRMSLLDLGIDFDLYVGGISFM